MVKNCINTTKVQGPSGIYTMVVWGVYGGMYSCRFYLMVEWIPADINKKVEFGKMS